MTILGLSVSEALQIVGFVGAAVFGAGKIAGAANVLTQAVKELQRGFSALQSDVNAIRVHLDLPPHIEPKE